MSIGADQGAGMTPGIPRVPSMNDAFRMVQAQTDLMSDLPAIIKELHRSVRDLSEALAASKDSAASAQRVTARVEALLDEIEEPVRALRPGLTRVAAAIDSPVVDRLPSTLETIERAVLPIAARLEAVSQRVEALTSRANRWVARLRPSGARRRPAVPAGSAGTY
jgi:hypothetical protein